MRQQSTPTVEEGKPLPIDLDTATEADIREAVEVVRRNTKQLVLPSLPPDKESVALIFSLFTCQRCGLCCSTGPQTPEASGIALWPDEHKRIARLLHVTVKRLRRICYRDDGYYHLQYPCPFYDVSQRACRIYRQRPFICRQYPIEGANELNQICMASLCPASREVAVQLLLASQRGWQKFRARVTAQIYGEVV